MEAVYAQYAWLVPLFPLIAFLLLMATGRGANRAGPLIGVTATLASFILALFVLTEQTAGEMAYVWNDIAVDPCRGLSCWRWDLKSIRSMH